MWAYAYMLGWKNNDKIDFDFHDAHGTNDINDTDSEKTVKQKLRERLSNTKQAIVIVGEKTKNLYRYVRWEIDICQELGIPIVTVNLNGENKLDPQLCPPILKGTPAIHISFKMKIIKHALDEFCEKFDQYKNGSDYFYPVDVYTKLGI
ncbi:TIR domain-containing protein [Burkholderia sp. R-70211]|nr:TIR domain-containing protein [Burkholderia sp. R-70211]